jgi:phosphatidylserine/phosphatidylglycerophosphate/cardiolipin synthase-like enzyme/membrane protein DedA with SNARE-associated domain
VENIFKPGQNCHKLAPAHRAAYLIDGEDYFGVLHQALRRARNSIFIVGWDLHSEVRLVRDADGYPQRLGKLLERLAHDRPGLQIFLLSWDFAMIYAMEREFFPRYKLKWRTHRNIHFILDGHHPVGASQHQKVVVIDDALAFAGGMDLSQWRWDTSRHRPRDDRRVDPGGRPYPPFHDVQMVVDGPAAAVLGELVRERWRRAEGTPPARPPADGDGDPWPPGLEPDFHDTPVAVARTLPEYDGQRAVDEVRQLYLDSIAAARRWIYIENQYLSAHCIGEALGARLEETDGPEVVIVLPEKTGGWLEQHTMDVLRGRLMARLRAADRHERLRVFFPRLAADADHNLMVHAKVMVVDNDFVRVGSSNLSNRSMGLDSECDLAIAAGSEDRERQETIAGFRNRLIAEHLGVKPGRVARAVEDHDSLIGAITSLRQGQRTLKTLPAEVSSEVDAWVPESDLLDPEKPVAPEKLLDLFVSPEEQPSAFRQSMLVIVLVAVVLSLAALWRWTPLGEWVDLEAARRVATWIQDQPLAPLLVAGVYVLGNAVAIPVTLMIIATVVVFGTWLGLVYALAGAWLSAVTLFGVGRWMGRKTVRRLAGNMLNRLSRKLADNGLLTVITFRIVPVAPFAVINLIAGVSEIRWRDFALGTLIGMFPGVIAIALLADRISASLRHPDLTQFTVLLASLALVGVGLVGLRRWVKRRRSAENA